MKNFGNTFLKRFLLAIIICQVSISVFAQNLENSLGEVQEIENKEEKQLKIREKEISGAKIIANGDISVADRRINLISRVLSSPWFAFSYKGLSVFIDVNQVEPRGQFYKKEMKLSAHISRDAEFIQLFTHELGHFVDIYLLRPGIGYGDPSYDFYKINWKEPKVKYPGTSLTSFISGYASTNQYEDFAESFVWYIFHNQDFAHRALKNEDLRKKYLFFADNVFVHGEFQGTDFSLGEMPVYLWDTTKIPILFQKYLSFLL